MIKNKLIPIEIAVAAVTGTAVGVFWALTGSSFNCGDWSHCLDEAFWFVPWIAYASFPLIIIDFNRLAIVLVPFLNGAMYGLLVYLILRNRPVVSVGIIFGYFVPVYWLFVDYFAMMEIYMPHPPYYWLQYASCPLIGVIGVYNLIDGFHPLINAMYVLLLIYGIRRYAKRPTALIFMILGYAVGMSFAVYANHGLYGMNVGGLFSNWISWLVYVTCPFVVIVRPHGIANGLVPLLNAFYGLFIYALFARIDHRFRVSMHSPTH